MPGRHAHQADRRRLAKIKAVRHLHQIALWQSHILGRCPAVMFAQDGDPRLIFQAAMQGRIIGSDNRRVNANRVADRELPRVITKGIHHPGAVSADNMRKIQFQPLPASPHP